MKNYNFVLVGVFCMLATGAHARGIPADIKASRMSPQAVQTLPVPTVLAPRAGAQSRKVFPFDDLVRDKTLPQALHYLDGSKASEAKQAQTTLAQPANTRKDVSEPASEVLLLIALSALAIAVRRQSPS